MHELGNYFGDIEQVDMPIENNQGTSLTRHIVGGGGDKVDRIQDTAIRLIAFRESLNTLISVNDFLSQNRDGFKYESIMSQLDRDMVKSIEKAIDSLLELSGDILVGEHNG